jgi:hypothetical protein
MSVGHPFVGGWHAGGDVVSHPDVCSRCLFVGWLVAGRWLRRHVLLRNVLVRFGAGNVAVGLRFGILVRPICRSAWRRRAARRKRIFDGCADIFFRFVVGRSLLGGMDSRFPLLTVVFRQVSSRRSLNDTGLRRKNATAGKRDLYAYLSDRV